MRDRCGLPRVRAWRAWLLVALGLTGGCASETTPDGQPDASGAGVVETASIEEPAQDSGAVALRRFLPDDMRRSTRAESFPHPAHLQIDCAVCHRVAQGHGTHASVACADCHRASAQITVRSLGPEQCAACHHGAEQRLTCENCHESRGVVRSEQRLALEVWTQSRSRTLTFDHGVHAQIECASCHTSAPQMVPAEPCASCHADHHVAEARCVACHTPPAVGAHGVGAHLTCSGVGCHRAPEVEAIADTRSVCVACHQAQEEHEPGGSCIECHRVRPDLRGRPGP